MSALVGKTAVVTGGTRGIGRSITELFLNQGANVIAVGRSAESGELLISTMKAGPRLRFHQADVSYRAGVESALDEAVSHFGCLDITVLNAGGSVGPSRIVDLSDEVWEEDLRLNLTHCFWGIRRSLQLMIPRRQGRVICISSKYGKIGRRGVASYVAAKHGLHGLVKTAALEVGDLGICVNAVCPGFVLTDLARQSGPAAARAMGLDSFDALIALHSSESAVGRPLLPTEIASLCLYLASDASSGITGGILNVDGGVSPY